MQKAGDAAANSFFFPFRLTAGPGRRPAVRGSSGIQQRDAAIFVRSF